MAFLNAVPLARRACAPPALSPRGPPPRAARPRRVSPIPAPLACEALHAAPAEVTVVQAPEQLDAVYAVWNAVAEAEGLRALEVDEVDEAHTTLHLVARDGAGRAIGAARLVRDAQNARLDRVCVLPDARGRGVGTQLVNALLEHAGRVEGAVYVNASRGSEMAFYSILGFDAVGNERVERGAITRTMMQRPPVCMPSAGCVGLHHASIRVSDIEHSLAFYGALGFVVSDKFLTSGGARACYVEGLGARLEFVEARDGGAAGLAGLHGGVPPTGFDRLVFDVTKACTDIEAFLQNLRRRHGGDIEIAAQPAQRVLGSSVVSVAVISDPDGLPIEFFRTEAQVPGELRTRVSW